MGEGLPPPPCFKTRELDDISGLDERAQSLLPNDLKNF